MRKAILVMDMPESCRECPLEIIRGQCAVNSEITKDNTVRPDWCPLREVPQKKPTIGKESENDILCMNAGYNACIDEILKGAEENG